MNASGTAASAALTVWVIVPTALAWDGYKRFGAGFVGLFAFSVAAMAFFLACTIMFASGEWS